MASESLKILIACGDYCTISGVPMFVYGLAMELHSRGHDVRVGAPNVDGIVAEKTRDAGIVCGSLTSIGTGFDVVHANGMHAAHWAAHAQPEAKIIATVHSTLVYETPYVHDRVQHYVGVRPQVVQKIIEMDGVPRKKTSVIFNGVDRQRFKPSPGLTDRPTVLFAGTVDYLRAQATGLMLDEAAKRGWDVLFVGRKMSGQMDDLPSHGRYIESDIWDIESLLGGCVATAGILLGRTTIEGWMCGLPGFIFEIDNEGAVTSWGEFPPPPPQIMEMFDIKYMTDRYEALYE